MGMNLKLLKRLALTDYIDKNYNGKSLIEIYVSDKKGYNRLVSQKKVPGVLSTFISKRSADIEKASKISSIPSRNKQYERIFDGYFALQQMKSDNPEIESDLEDSKEEIKQMQSFLCPVHKQGMKKLGIKEARNNNKEKLTVPVYWCKSCDRLYTHIPGYADGKTLMLSGLRYTNIATTQTQKPVSESNSKSGNVTRNSKNRNCIVYGLVKPSVCNTSVCNKAKLLKTKEQFYTKENKKTIIGVKKCPVCGTLYLGYATYQGYSAQLNCLNNYQLEAIKDELVQKEKRLKEEKAKTATKATTKATTKTTTNTITKQKKTKPEQRLENQKKIASDPEIVTQKKNAEHQKRMEERVQEFLRQEREKRRLAEQKELENQKRAEEFERKQRALINSGTQHGGTLFNHDNNIRVKDFVVRRNIFKCRHQEHVLRNIDATIEVIDARGEILKRTVAAGYCANCDTFFIMESTYQYLRKFGTPACRVSDEKSYLKGPVYVNGMKLAQESILMQFGYSVSQGENLSTMQRRKILSLLIDNDILTRNDIIGYLDFFIGTKMHQKKFEKAVDKWEDDRDFIAEYKIGSYAKYGVGGLHRK